MSLEQGQVPTRQWQAPRSTPHISALDLLHQETLGEYEILAELGRGGMATVYLAHDIALDRKVAIKVMSTATLDEGMAERFRREARTAAALNHPHIIPVYAVRERGGLLYFVMKFIAGQSLDPIIRTQGRVSISMAHVVLAQAAAALGYAHRRGVIHRDVKPANIMLDDEGWVVMTDFGIAKVATATGLTMTGVTVGTPAYMSPEQCAGKEVTGASDQYSLGVVAYEIITGQKPFAATTAMAMMYAHFNETPVPIRQLRPDCPPELEERVLRMLAKEPEERWPSIEEVFGPPVLAHDDPTRQEMIGLALSGPSATLVSQLSTPTSPIPPARRSSMSPAVPPGYALPRPAAGSQPPSATGYGSMPPAIDAVPEPMAPPRRPRLSIGDGSGLNKWGIAGLAAAIVILIGSYLATREPSRPPATSPAAVDSPRTQVPSPPVNPPIARDTTPPVVDSARVPAPAPAPQPTAPAPAATVAAVSAVRVTPSSLELDVGQRSRLNVQLVREDGTTQRDPGAVEWRSMTPRIAVVTRAGEVHALSAGRALLIAATGGKADTVAIDVKTPVVAPIPVASLTVAPDSVSLAVGGSVTLAATPRDAARAALSGREVAWSSSSRVAVVSAAGLVQAVAPGTATVTATSEGRSAQVTVVVTAVPVAGVTLTGPAAPLKVGETVSLAATVRDAQGETLGDRKLTWESSDPAIASVVNGVVTARAAGSATITATAERQSASVKVTVAVPADPVADRARATTDIQGVLNAFAAGLTRRDVAQLRQAYPTLPSTQEEQWRSMLTEKTLRTIQATFEPIDAVHLEPSTATQRVRLRLQQVFSGRPAENLVFNYVARFEQTSGGWKLVQLQAD